MDNQEHPDTRKKSNRKPLKAGLKGESILKRFTPDDEEEELTDFSRGGADLRGSKIHAATTDEEVEEEEEQVEDESNSLSLPTGKRRSATGYGYPAEAAGYDHESEETVEEDESEVEDDYGDDEVEVDEFDDGAEDDFKIARSAGAGRPKPDSLDQLFDSLQEDAFFGDTIDLAAINRQFRTAPGDYDDPVGRTSDRRRRKPRRKVNSTSRVEDRPRLAVEDVEVEDEEVEDDKLIEQHWSLINHWPPAAAEYFQLIVSEFLFTYRDHSLALLHPELFPAPADPTDSSDPTDWNDEEVQQQRQRQKQRVLDEEEVERQAKLQLQGWIDRSLAQQLLEIISELNLLYNPQQHFQQALTISGRPTPAMNVTSIRTGSAGAGNIALELVKAVAHIFSMDAALAETIFSVRRLLLVQVNFTSNIHIYIHIHDTINLTTCSCMSQSSARRANSNFNVTPTSSETSSVDTALSAGILIN